jgi:WhiB family redox-sensing transcriptional regulator
LIENQKAYEDGEWIDYGACTVPGAPSMFPYEGDKHGIELAKNVCEGCSVVVECLFIAIARGEQWGIWGGMTTDERKTYRRKQLRARPVSDAG